MSAQPRNAQNAKPEVFSSRNFFIVSAIGSAVGLGNIWRFPYVAYTHGGGAFLIPYLVALLSAGIPLLFFDYAIGHRYRGSAPLALRRLGGRATEAIGWWQVLVSFVIAIYYAAIVAWAAMYTLFSLTKAWGDDPEAFLFTQFLHVAETPGVGFDFVPGLLIPILAVWLVTLGILARGVNKGLAAANMVFMPLLVAMFAILVVRSLFLPGAAEGLNHFFTPDWAALTDPSVWAAAYSQIFFSLSVGFGIMLTYASYLKRRTDLTGSGLVVGFANSSFELLAGIGVFAALGFMAHSAGVGVGDVVSSGLTLAFVAFPTIITQAPGGEVMGVLFFGSLVFAGITSMVSIIEVVMAGVRDKLGVTKNRAILIVGAPMALISTSLLATTTGIYFLDITDEFVNKFGILAGAFACVIAVAWFSRRLPTLQRHLDRFSSFGVGRPWVWIMGALVPLVLGYILLSEFVAKVQDPYGSYPTALLGTFGWGMAGTLVVLGVVMSRLPWRRARHLDFDEAADDHGRSTEDVNR